MLGGVKEALVWPFIKFPPKFKLLVLLYHWYIGLPVPLEYAIFNDVVVPSKQIVWDGKGCIVNIGAVVTVIPAIAEVTEQLNPLWVIKE